MKISNNDQVLKGHIPEPKFKTELPASKEFNAILKETVGNSPKAAAGLPPATIIHPASAVQPISPSPPDTQFTIERIEKLIDLLDQYRQKLADPRITLRNIAPLIKEMTQEKENLNPVLDSLQDGEALKQVLNQTLVTASLEIAKYYRGDYIPA